MRNFIRGKILLVLVAFFFAVGFFACGMALAKWQDSRQTITINWSITTSPIPTTLPVVRSTNE